MSALIFVPVDDMNIAKNFYGNVMGFPGKNNRFSPSFDCSCVQLNLTNVDDDTRAQHGLSTGKIRFPLFRYSIESNFLSYCRQLVNKGVTFDMAASHPEGYIARIIDPFGNTFEFECLNWDDETPDIDPFQWPFYQRY